MTDMNDIAEAAARLVLARRQVVPQAAPTLASAQAAYAVQAQVARVLGWFDDPRRPMHWKSGGATRDGLTHAALPPAGIWPSPARAGAWPFRLRGIEAEVALRLREPVDAARAAALDEGQARALVDAMTVSIEVVDSRWTEGLDAPPLAKLADLQCHGALVLGEWVAFDAGRDWSRQRCEVQIGAQPAQSFVGSHSLGDPAAVLWPWLQHATRDGTVLAAGSVVTTGSWCGLLHAQPGDGVDVRFEGLGAARLQC